QGLQTEIPGERFVAARREEHVRATPIERQIGVSRERSRVLERRGVVRDEQIRTRIDRKSTRLNSSHRTISYAVFCLKLRDLVGLGGKSAADKGKDTRDYLAAAFPELNAWERAGADASSAGMVDAGFENQKELTKMQLDNQKEIAEMQNETQKEIAGIQ